MGTVADEDDPKSVIGFFRVTRTGLETQYADGRSETLLPNAGGGVSIASKARTGESFCMAWYPEGHVFSAAERKAALAEYADRLGLGRDAAKDATPASACAPAAATQAVPRSSRIGKPGSSAAQNNVSPQPVIVRTSVVHPVRDDLDDSPTQALNAGSRASDCLHVESDGANWGFRNACGHSVQFAFCVMNGAAPLAACDKGSVPGSVAPNGFAALFADGSFREAGADHDFRWVACDGGTGDVIPHLDQASPPAGRCVRATAS